MVEYQIIKSPIGNIKVTLSNNVVIKINLHSNEKIMGNILSIAQTQLLKYFSNPTQTFTFPYQFQGTDFQQSVCTALLSIPLGQTLTYSELAKKLQSHPRAIGQALKRNPVPILFPCHRVVSQNGIGGFSGAMEGDKITAKRWLLNHESAFSNLK